MSFRFTMSKAARNACCCLGFFFKRNHGRISMCKLFVTDIDTYMYNNNKNLQVIGDKYDV